MQFAFAAIDYYKELGVSREASDGEIKKAFRKLSLQYHPDKNQGNAEAHARFTRISEAYDVLSTPEKRQVYDIHGEEAVKKNNNNQPASPFDFGHNPGQRKGHDFRMDFLVTLEDMYLGGTRAIAITRKVLCKKCRGTGAKDGETSACKNCQGKGVVLTLQQLGPGFNIQMQQPCPVCSGRGKSFKHKCPVCSGSKLVDEQTELKVVIERGMKEGEEIVFERMSEQHPDMVPGDVIVKLKTHPHHLYTRRDNDLLHTMTISLREALLGFDRVLTHLDGHQVKVVRNNVVTEPFHVMRIEGEGMPVHNFPSQKGVLEITFVVEFPSMLTDKQQEEVKKLLK